jgi:hypothetical protein
MNDIQNRVMREDMENEFQWRLQLRDALQQTLDLLTNPDSDENDANRIVALINQTLEETAP